MLRIVLLIVLSLSFLAVDQYGGTSDYVFHGKQGGRSGDHTGG
jgi:hypothetical protein